MFDPQDRLIIQPLAARTVVEGIGLNRITENFARAVIEDAFRVEDQETVYMSRWLVAHDALFAGSSTAVNCVAAGLNTKRCCAFLC
jgi:cysteine synthase A